MTSQSDHAALLALFECPVCKTHATPPFQQCRNGHIVCNTCRPQVRDNRCPVCRANYKRQVIRNLSLETLANTMGADEGLVTMEQLIEHRTSCSTGRHRVISNSDSTIHTTSYTNVRQREPEVTGNPRDNNNHRPLFEPEDSPIVYGPPTPQPLQQSFSRPMVTIPGTSGQRRFGRFRSTSRRSASSGSILQRDFFIPDLNALFAEYGQEITTVVSHNRRTDNAREVRVEYLPIRSDRSRSPSNRY